MTSADNWPAPADAVQRAVATVRALAPGSSVAVAVDRDVDGLASGVILTRMLERLGHSPQLVVAHRGEHVHTDAMRARIARHTPAALLVADMGSRAGAIVAGVPTVVLDHHRPTGTPDGAVLVSAHDCEPIASSSWLAHHFAARLADVSDLTWLAVLGAHADLGANAPLPGFAAALAAAGKTHVGKAVSLLNAARRAADPIEDLAARVLLASSSAADIARGRTPGVDALEAARASVADETARCGRVAPKITGRCALIRFTSRAQVHPLVATRWMTRLRDKIVVVANDGYLPGRVNFAVRSALDVDLLDFLAEHRPANAGPEFGNGHARATGGSLEPRAFDEFVATLT